MRFTPENVAPDGRRLHSKSEVCIYMCLIYNVPELIWDVNFWYERRIHGTCYNDRWSQFPDFTFADHSGKLLIWEHLGMVGDEKYDGDWERKIEWYAANGYDMGYNLIVTKDIPCAIRRNSTYIDLHSITRREIEFVRDWISR